MLNKREMHDFRVVGAQNREKDKGLNKIVPRYVHS